MIDSGGGEHLPVSGPRNLALGIERIGLLPIRYPWAVAVAFLALLVLGAVGFERLKVDDSLSQLFRSDTAEFKQYEDVTRRFPSSEFDVLVVVADLVSRTLLPTALPVGIVTAAVGAPYLLRLLVRGRRLATL